MQATSPLVLHADAILTCSHGGTVQITPTQTAVQVGGLAVATEPDVMVVAGCPAGSPGSPPCSTVAWTGVSAVVRAGGNGVLLQPVPPAGAGVAGAGVVTGPPAPTPLVVQMQTRVVAR